MTLRSPAAAAGGPGQFGAALTLEELRAFLTSRGVSKEYFPEYLVVMDQFPLSIGGKVAREELKDKIFKILSHERHQYSVPSQPAGQGGSHAGRDHGQER